MHPRRNDRRAHRPSWAWIFVLPLTAIGGCQDTDPALETASPFVDDAGKAIPLDRTYARIVSLSPAITELLFAIGAGDRLVGRTRWGADPRAALEVPSVGDGLDPNIEAILGRRPDLVLFYRSGSNAAAIDRLDRLGIVTASLALDRLDDLTRAARLLGRMTARADTVEGLLADFRTELGAVSAPDPEGPRVLMLAWDNPPIVIGGASFLSEIVRRAGGINVFDDDDRPSLTVSLETVAARRPDVVLVTGAEDPAFANRPEWSAVTAIRERRFAEVTGTAFSHPSFRAVDAIRQLRAVLDRVRS